LGLYVVCSVVMFYPLSVLLLFLCTAYVTVQVGYIAINILSESLSVTGVILL